MTALTYEESCEDALRQGLLAAARIQSCAEDPAALAPEAVFNGVRIIGETQSSVIRAMRLAILEFAGEAVSALEAGGAEKAHALRVLASELHAGAAFVVRAAR